MFKIYDDKDLFIKENKLTEKEKLLVKKITKLDNLSYLIKVKGNFVISNNKCVYLNNDNSINVIVDTLYKYNLLLDETNNIKLALNYAKLFNGKVNIDKDDYKIVDKKVGTALLAGGCFWCAAYAYFKKPGIINVFSGYAGGYTHMPTYEEVKKDITGHMESILIYYDITKTSYKEILDIFFITIDPFDDKGQFIDRGSNYKTAIFSSNEADIFIAKEKIDEVSKFYEKDVKVKILDDTIFYYAEEYHQDYGIKNPELMKEELIKSGRVKE